MMINSCKILCDFVLFCQNCGVALGPDDRFCGQCRTQVEQVVRVQESSVAATGESALAEVETDKAAEKQQLEHQRLEAEKETKRKAEEEEQQRKEQAQARLDAIATKKKQECQEAERKAREQAAWQAVEDSRDADTIKAFLKEWPNGVHAKKARRLQRALKTGLITRLNILIGGGALIGAAGGTLVNGLLVFAHS